MSTTDHHPADSYPNAKHTPGRGQDIPIVRLGLSLSCFLAISFALCAAANVISGLESIHLLSALYPGMDWTRPGLLIAGVVWAFATGWFVALGFGALYNLFGGSRR